MNLFQKQPADQLDYDLDFSDWLISSDEITGVVATSNLPEELLVLSASVIDQTVKIWIAGGLDGSTYKVTSTIATAEGRIKEIEFKIRVRNL
jgi:hypothetical protein